MQDQNYSFVVRLWLEETHGDRTGAIWRGSIEQVGGDCRMYFSDLNGIPRYIQMQIGATAVPPVGWRFALERAKNGFQKLWKNALRRRL